MQPIIIEKMAVNAIDDLITDKCPLLVSNINQNDKTPLYDGDISVYSSEKISNENFIGKVPIQLKGQYQKNKKPPFSYKFKITDLKYYLNNGGVLFFVVSINNDAKTIYYLGLSVIKLQNILSKIQTKQKNITLNLKKFPCTTNEIMDVIRNFYEDMNKQHSFATQEPHTLKYWEKQPNFRGITIGGFGYGKTKPSPLDILKSVNAHDIYAYAQVEGHSIPIPISDENLKLVLCNKSNDKIKIKNKIFYDNFLIIRDEEAIRLQFGNAFNVTMFLNSDKAGEFKYTRPSNINDILAAISLMKYIIQEKEIDLGKLHVPIDIDLSMEEIIKEEEQYTQIAELLKELNIKAEEIKFNELTKSDYFNLYILYRGIVKKEISPDFTPKDQVEHAKLYNISLGDKVVQVLITKEENGSKIEDCFNIKDRSWFLETTEGLYVPCTLYSWLDRDDYCKILNLHYENIIAFNKHIYEIYPYALTQTIHILNEILKAYDKCQNIRLLKTAEELNEFLKNIDIEDITPNSKELCTLEIIKRQRKLTTKEKQSLYSIVSKKENDIDTISALILLEDKESVDELLLKQTNNIQVFIKEQPIYNLYLSIGQQQE